MQERVAISCGPIKPAALGIRSPVGCVREMTLREGAAGAGLEVLLEARGSTFVWELHRDDDRPGAILARVPTRPGVVPLESLVDVRGAANVVSGWIAVASKEIDEPSTGVLHLDRSGIFRASENYEESEVGT
jgi:hypothetical protein